MGEFGDDVRRRGRYQRDIGFAHEPNVRNALGRVPERRVDRPRRQRRERQRGYETLGPGGHHHVDGRAALYERARERGGFISGDTAAYAEQNASVSFIGRHPQVVDQARRSESRRADDERRPAEPLERLEIVGIHDVEIIQLRRRVELRGAGSEGVALVGPAFEQHRGWRRARDRAMAPPRVAQDRETHCGSTSPGRRTRARWARSRD